MISTLLQTWHSHVNEHSRNKSVIARVFGVYTIKISNRASFDLILMQNLLPPELNVHAVFDLDGDMAERLSPFDRNVKCIKDLPKGKVYNDVDFKHLSQSLNVKFEDHLWIRRIVQGDVDMLKSLNIVRYSLFVAVGELVVAKYALQPRYSRHVYLGTGDQSSLCYVIGIIDYLQVAGKPKKITPTSTPLLCSRQSQLYGEQFMKLLEDITKAPTCD